MNRRSFLYGTATTSGLAAITAASGASALARAATPAAAAKPPMEYIPDTRSTFNGVTLGCNTYSMSHLPLAEVLKACRSIGFGEIELHPCHVEPQFGNPIYFRAKTPESRAAAQAAREKLRHWRLATPLEYFEKIGRQVAAAGQYLYSYNMNFNNDCTDEEIDRTFLMTKAMGCHVMTAVASRKTFERLPPFIAKHKIWTAIHNEPDSIPNIRTFDALLGGAPANEGICLDIGHFVAANAFPAACLYKLQARTFDLHLKDRKRDNGPMVPFGQGDTPIRQVLWMDRDYELHIPVQIEYGVPGPNLVESVRTAFEYSKRALLYAPAYRA